MRNEHFLVQNDQKCTFGPKMRKYLPKSSIFVVLEQHFCKWRQRSEKVLIFHFWTKKCSFLTFGPKSAFWSKKCSFLTFGAKMTKSAILMKMIKIPSILPRKNKGETHIVVFERFLGNFSKNVKKLSRVGESEKIFPRRQLFSLFQISAKSFQGTCQKRQCAFRLCFS